MTTPVTRMQAITATVISKIGERGFIPPAVELKDLGWRGQIMLAKDSEFCASTHFDTVEEALNWLEDFVAKIADAPTFQTQQLQKLIAVAVDYGTEHALDVAPLIQHNKTLSENLLT